MNAHNKLSLVTMLGILACTNAIAANPPDISGNYTCKGVTPGVANPNFSETIVIKKNGDTFMMQMTHPGDMIPYNFGTALFNKDVNNAFALVYWDPKKTSYMGTELFIIKPDGSLDGAFADSNTTQHNTETCTKSS